MILLKVAAVAVAGAVLGLVIKKNSPDMSLMLTIALAMAGLYLAFDVIVGVVEFIRTLAEATNISLTAVEIVFKTVGISLVTKLASDVCRDAGQSSVASGVELVGSLTALYISLPLFESVVSMIRSLV